MTQSNSKLKKIHTLIYSPTADSVVMFFIILSIGILVLEIANAIPLSMQYVVSIIDLSLNSFFVIEYGLKFSLASNKRLFFTKNIIDFLALLPIFRIFRIFRILRLLRLLNIKAMNHWISIIQSKSSFFGEGVSQKLAEAVILVFLLLGVVFIATIGILSLEQGQNDQFSSLGDGFWWSIVTLTTVGYGDKFPVTAGGRVLATFIMIGGLGFFALITSLLSSFIIELYSREKEQKMTIKQLADHIIICGWNGHADKLVGQLHNIHQQKNKKVLIISEKEPAIALSKNCLYLNGDYTKKEALESGQVKKASSIILLADSSITRTEQDTDARTILAAHLVKQLAPSAYICAEIMSEDNKSALKTTGVNEYVVTSSYTGVLLATCTKQPGITGVFNALLQQNDGRELNKVPVPKQLLGKTFLEGSNIWLKKYNSILIGIERDSKLFINPNKTESLNQEDFLIVIDNNLEKI